MKWSLDIGIAAGLTVLVWFAFYLTFPSDPLGAAETAFVLAVFYALVKLCRWAWARRSIRPGAGTEAGRK